MREPTAWEFALLLGVAFNMTINGLHCHTAAKTNENKQKVTLQCEKVCADHKVAYCPVDQPDVPTFVICSDKDAPKGMRFVPLGDAKP